MGCSSSKNFSQQPKHLYVKESSGQGWEQEEQVQGHEQELRDPYTELNSSKQIDLNEKINMLMIRSPAKDNSNGKLEDKESERQHGDNIMTKTYKDVGHENGKSIFSWLSIHRAKDTSCEEQPTVPTSSYRGKDASEVEVCGKGNNSDDDFSLLSVLKTSPLQTKTSNNEVVYRDLGGNVYYPDGSIKKSPPSSQEQRSSGEEASALRLMGTVNVNNEGGTNKPPPTMDDLIRVYKKYELEYDEDGRVAGSVYTGEKYKPRQITCVEAATENIVDEVNCF